MSTAKALRPIRQHRAPFVKPASEFNRRCVKCGTDFLKTDGGAAESGPWSDWKWFCSIECRGSEQP